jgi:hypothetical protein
MDYWDPAIIGQVYAAGCGNLNDARVVQNITIAVSARKIQLNTVFPQTALALIIAPP